jgi:hypothetical protein
VGGGGSKVEKSLKKFLAFMDVFHVFVVQQGEITTQNQETTKFMSRIVEGLGTINSVSNGGSANVTIKAKLPNSFIGKETKIK